MAHRDASLPPEMAGAVEPGHQAFAEWELENGPATPEELASGRARARALLGRDAIEPARSDGSARDRESFYPGEG